MSLLLIRDLDAWVGGREETGPSVHVCRRWGFQLPPPQAPGSWQPSWLYSRLLGAEFSVPCSQKGLAKCGSGCCPAPFLPGFPAWLPLLLGLLHQLYWLVWVSCFTG